MDAGAVAEVAELPGRLPERCHTIAIAGLYTAGLSYIGLNGVLLAGLSEAEMRMSCTLERS